MLPISSILCVPLGVGEERFGVINLSNSSGDDRLFSSEDIRFVKSLSLYASVALTNALGLRELTSATHTMMNRFHTREPEEGD